MTDPTPAPVSEKAKYFYALGAQSQSAADYATAAQRFQFALEHSPSNVEIRFRRACCLQNAGQVEEAVREYESVLSLDSTLVSAKNNLGNAYATLMRLPEALSYLENVVESEPDYADGHANLGNVLARLGRYDEAQAALRTAIALNSEVFSYWYNLANVLQSLQRMDEAIRCYRKSAEIEEHFAGCYNNLGNAHRSLGQYTEALEAFEKAVTLEPDNATTYANLGGLLSDAGELLLAKKYYDKALAKDADCISAFSNKLYLLNYLPDEPIGELLAASRAFGDRFAPRRSGYTSRMRTSVAPSTERLRVGFISADFRRHSVAYFFEALLDGLDDDDVQIYCYANLSREDDVSARIRAKSHHWRPIAALSDDQVAGLIERDEIDLLVDLSGHTSGNRLPVFSYRPAPVQATWLGYPNTTGVEDIDYRITDSVVDPLSHDSHYSETPWRLPSLFLCYRPDPTAPAVGELPLLRNGYLSFGSFNNLNKVTDDVIATWARLLIQVPNSILVIKSKMLVDASMRRRINAKFMDRGVPPTRLRLVERDASFDLHMQRYNEVDIALDTFPYNGTTTTCEALWMGVPVLGLRGASHRSRVTLSIATQLGLDRFVVDDERQLIGVANELQRFPDQLACIRSSLRDRLQQSTLCDSAGFAQNMTNAFRRMASGDRPD